MSSTEAPTTAPAEEKAETPDLATQAVLVESVEMPEGTPTCKGYDFNAGVNMDGIMEAYKYMGFQGTNLGKAVERINEMVSARRWCTHVLVPAHHLTHARGLRVCWCTRACVAAATLAPVGRAVGGG